MAFWCLNCSWQTPISVFWHRCKHWQVKVRLGNRSSHQKQMFWEMQPKTSTAQLSCRLKMERFVQIQPLIASILQVRFGSLEIEYPGPEKCMENSHVSKFRKSFGKSVNASFKIFLAIFGIFLLSLKILWFLKFEFLWKDFEHSTLPRCTNHDPVRLLTMRISASADQYGSAPDTAK